MNSLIKTYISADFRKSPFSFLKGILILIPVLSIVGMLATAQHVPVMNQKAFLHNADYDWISFSSEKPLTENYYRYLDTNIAHIEPSNEGVYYRNSYPLELYFVEELNDFHTEDSTTYFNNRNHYKGDVTNLSTSDESIGIALSYNAAKKLKVKMNDTASLYFENDDGIHVYPITVKAIIKTKYPSGDNSYGGLGLAEVNPVFQAFLEENNIQVQYAKFGTTEDSVQDNVQHVVYKEEQLSDTSLGLLTLPNRVVTTLLLPALGISVIFLLIRREVGFEISRRMRSIGILTALGAPNNVIINIFLVEHILKILIASLFATLIYKYILFEGFIGELVSWPLFISILCIYILLGIISLYVAMFKVRAILTNLSVHEIVSKKEQ